MKAKIQKKLARALSGKSTKKIKLVPERLEDIKEAITRSDVRSLIKDRAILIERKRGSSKGRIRKDKEQRNRGRKRGQGSRKGKAGARIKSKTKWVNKIRLQRKFLADLKQRKKVGKETYKDLYRKSKGGFFRSKKHIKIYITEHKLIK